MSRTTQRRSRVRPPWGTWGGVCQKSPAFTGCSTPSWIRIHSPSRHTPHGSFGCECTGDTECGSSVTTDSIALTPGKIRAEMPGASCRTMPPSRRLWNIRSPFVSVYSRDLNPYSNSRSQGGPVRFFVAMFSHETNTFSTIPTDRRQFEARDLRHGYKTYPHVDMDARGREATERLRDVVAKRRRPTVAWRQPPLLPPIAGQLTARGPMRRLYDRAAEMERDPRVVTISIFAGFPLADIRDAGLSVYVATDGDPGLADRLADELATMAWAHRGEFLHTAPPPGEAVARALAADGRPVVLADIADNTGGGAAGDTTEILRELLRVGARPATVACIWDAEAVQACARAGVGATVTVDVGGKVDPSHGAPVRVTGRVRTL